MLKLDDVRNASGMKVIDPDGDKIGSVDTIYIDDQTDTPEFALVNTGLFGASSSFVPLASAEMTDDAIRVPHAKDQVKDAPRIDAEGRLTQSQEQEIYSYYGMDYTDRHSGTGLPEEHQNVGGTGAPVTGSDAPVTGTETSGAGYDTSGPTTDNAMTRSEEELRVGTTEREAGRVRLRKLVDSERVTETVPVRHEDVHIEREPITDANADNALDGPAISEEEHEVVLHDEEPVVEKRVVPKERVRLDKEVHTEQETVSDEIRKERIEVDDDRAV